MAEPTNPRRPKQGHYQPNAETLALLKVSGNPINGLGETTPRQASPFFWHPPALHPYAELQNLARQSSRKCPGSAPAFLAAYTHPELLPVAAERNQAAAEELSAALTEYALAHEADDVGIAAMDPLYVFEGYTIDEPWVVVLALAHNYERLKEVPSDETNGVGVTDIGDQYARVPGTVCRCAATDSAGHRLWIGRAGQARVVNQPPLWFGCAPRGRNDGYAAGRNQPGPLRSR